MHAAHVSQCPLPTVCLLLPSVHIAAACLARSSRAGRRVVTPVVCYIYIYSVLACGFVCVCVFLCVNTCFDCLPMGLAFVVFCLLVVLACDIVCLLLSRFAL